MHWDCDLFLVEKTIAILLLWNCGCDSISRYTFLSRRRQTSNSEARRRLRKSYLFNFMLDRHVMKFKSLVVHVTKTTQRIKFE